MKTFLLVFCLLFTVAVYSQTETTKPDSTIYKYLITQINEQQSIIKKYEDTQIVREYIMETQKLQKLIDMINEQIKILQPKEDKKK